MTSAPSVSSVGTRGSPGFNYVSGQQQGCAFGCAVRPAVCPTSPAAAGGCTLPTQVDPSLVNRTRMTLKE
eukprot:134758-Amphidinium_carterae.1